MAVPVLIASDGKRLASELSNRISEVRVEQFANEPATYSIRLVDDIVDQQPAVADVAALQPGRVLTVAVSTEQGIQCLIHGPVEQQRVHLSAGGAGSWTEVRGRDRRSELSKKCVTAVWTKTSASQVVQTILGKYGFATKLPTTGPVTGSRLSFHQRDTDLTFVEELIERFGLEFWLDAQVSEVASGMKVKETAHVGASKAEGSQSSIATKLAIVGAGKARLQMNDSNGSGTITSLTVDVDVARPVTSTGSGYDDRAGRVERFSLAGPAGATGTSLRNHSNTQVCVVAAGTVADLRVRSEAHLHEASWFVRAAASTTASLLGRALFPHETVAVEGAGRTHSGDYQVAEVVHVLTSASHMMDLTLRRTWLGA